MIRLFLYGMRQRGFSPGCQPKENFVARFDDDGNRYHDLLVYSAKLMQKDEKNYDLDYLGTIEENRVGEWLISSDGYYPYCSVCGKEPKELTDFCPKCGANMRHGETLTERLYTRDEVNTVLHGAARDGRNGCDADMCSIEDYLKY